MSLLSATAVIALLIAIPHGTVANITEVFAALAALHCPLPSISCLSCQQPKPVVVSYIASTQAVTVPRLLKDYVYMRQYECTEFHSSQREHRHEWRLHVLLSYCPHCHRMRSAVV
jgi:hypothetical protein